MFESHEIKKALENLEGRSNSKKAVLQIVRDSITFETFSPGGAGGAGSDTSNYGVRGRVTVTLQSSKEEKEFVRELKGRGPRKSKEEEIIRTIADDLWEFFKPVKKRKPTQVPWGAKQRRRTAKEVRGALKDQRSKNIQDEG